MSTAMRLATIAVLALFLATAVHAQRVRRVVDLDGDLGSQPAMSDDGSTVLHVHDGVLWRRDLPAATATAIASATAYWSPSISDDGTIAAVTSNLDPLGQNADGSLEVFTISTADGSVLSQVTDLPANAPFRYALSGDGSRLALAGPLDPIGSNPGLVEQVFVVVIGAFTRQATSFTDGTITEVSITDDGSRIAFRHVDGSGTATANHVPSLGGPVTDVSTAVATNPRDVTISGDGTTIAFEDDGVFAVNLQGQVLFANPDGTNPSLTDDGTVYLDVVEDVYERSIFEQGTRVLDPPDPVHAFDPLVSGDGSALLFYGEYGSFAGFSNEDGSVDLGWVLTDGTLTTALTDSGWQGRVQLPVISGDGTRVAFTVNSSGNSLNSGGVYVVEPDGFGLRRVAIGDGAAEVGLDPDGDSVVFLGQTNLLEDPACGTGSATSTTMFAVQADGTGLTQLRPCDEWLKFLDVYGGGIVVEDAGQLVVRNLGPAGQMLNDVQGGPTPVNYREPRADDVGTWVAFKLETSEIADQGRQIWRARTDGSMAEAITTDPVYLSENGPDISADGTRIVFDSAWDPLGTNTDHNLEIFLVEYPAGTITQLTDTTAGDNLRPLISGNGEWVWFASSSGYFGNPGIQLYRVAVAGGSPQRVQGLANGTLVNSLCEYSFGPYAARARPCFSVDSSGQRGAVATGTGLDGTSGDGELYLVEFDASNRWTIPTGGAGELSWQVDPRFVSYDVLRGDLANLAPGAGGTVSLGAVVCLESDSLDTTVPGDVDPVPGQGFFYLYRGSAGVLDPGTWGQGAAGGERVPTVGDCS